MQEGFPEEAPHVTLQSLYQLDTIKGTPRAQVFDKARAKPDVWAPLAVRLLIVVALKTADMRALSWTGRSVRWRTRCRGAVHAPRPLPAVWDQKTPAVRGQNRKGPKLRRWLSD
jgi:hypothetical protein